MLSKLFGSKSASEILLFMLINRKGYASQIATCLNLPLTPLQKALAKLEGAGILVSYYEGKTKVFQFNSSYPLKNELEKLLQKTFSLLPPEKKEKYPFTTDLRALKISDQPRLILNQFWIRLKTVKRALIFVQQKDPRAQTFQGEGSVLVRQSENSLIFEEEGKWNQEETKPIHYRNALKWTINYASSLIALEHLRFGENHPVFMFYLRPKKENLLESDASHLCGEDTYFGLLKMDSHSLKLIWKAIGPNKNESIESIYS